MIQADVVVIGAGTAGLACAKVLVGAGAKVVVVDKGRGPGGRVATRRDTVQLPAAPSESGAATEVRFDHGAQFLTARDEGFRRQVSAWEAGGVVARWNPVSQVLNGAEPGVRRPRPLEHERWVGVPGMNAIGKHLSTGLDVRYSTRAISIARLAGGGGGGYRVTTVLEGTGGGGGGGTEGGEGGPLVTAGRCVVAVPDVQAGPLVADIVDLPPTYTEPCWSVMACLGREVDLGFDWGECEHSALGRVVREGSKPGRAAVGAWVLHATPAWSRDHLERKPEEIAPELWRVFVELLGEKGVGEKAAGPLTPVYLRGHRWRYAQTTTPAGVDCVTSDDQTLAVCGDYLLGGRIEAAWLSGVAAARAVWPGAVAR